VANCEHEIVFAGMINVNRDNYLQGVTDVWICRKCRKLFCDDKRYNEPLKPSVGFEEIAEDEEWAILTCTSPREVFMQSIPVKPGKVIEHSCKNGEKHSFKVGEKFELLGNQGTNIHMLFRVKDYINKQIEAGYYRLTMK
jgi:hypothetical protein